MRCLGGIAMELRAEEASRQPGKHGRAGRELQVTIGAGISHQLLDRLGPQVPAGFRQFASPTNSTTASDPDC